MSNDAYRHLFLTANMSYSAFAESKTMETFHPDMSTYVKSCTQTRPRKSEWCRVISWSVVLHGQSSWSSWSVVVVSRFSWSVSRLNRCGQSSWPVVLPAESAFFLVVVVSRSSWSVVVVSRFFVVSQSFLSSWSVDVVSCSQWMVFIFYGGYAHVFTETYGWGKPRSMSGQMYGGWVEHV